MIIYLAALQAIPEEYIEAAQVDGANWAQVLVKIKIPLLSPVILLCSMLGISYSLKLFDLPYAMTSGGPNHASTTMVMRIYYEMTRSWRYGYASAESVILFAIIAILTLGLNHYMKKLEDSI
jgi:raffinose/stachyose/melibiose transport system permease protein